MQYTAFVWFAFCIVLMLGDESFMLVSTVYLHVVGVWLSDYVMCVSELDIVVR